jgi:hypothetical protein
MEPWIAGWSPESDDRAALIASDDEALRLAQLVIEEDAELLRRLA